MFNFKFRTACINAYNKLNKYNIKGDNKKKFITKSFNIHINSLYNWLKDDNNENNENNETKNDKNIKIKNNNFLNQY